jgi:hypothetical protein
MQISHSNGAAYEFGAQCLTSILGWEGLFKMEDREVFGHFKVLFTPLRGSRLCSRSGMGLQLMPQGENHQIIFDCNRLSDILCKQRKR